MCILILFSLYLNDLLKYKNCVIRTYFQRDFLFIKKNFIRKEKPGTVTKVKLVTKIKKHNQLYFGTFLLASYYYCGGNA